MFSQKTTLDATRARFAACALASAIACFVAQGCASPSSNAAARNAQGVQLFSAGRYDDAIACFEASLEENPDSAETYYNLGSALQRKANETNDAQLLERAEDAYWTALELDPAPETIVCCYRGVATAAARGDAKSGLAALEQWRDRNPQSIEPRLEIAYLLESQEKDAEAYALLKEIAEDAPDDYRAYYKMGALAERAGDLADAVENANLAVKLNPTDSTVVQRANLLEAEFEAQRRRAEIAAKKEKTNDDDASVATVLDAPQTARVSPTAAQTEQEVAPSDAPGLALPAEPENVVLPDAAPAPAPTPAPAAQKLGFGVPTSLRDPKSDASDDTPQNVAQDDSDVKWLTPPRAEETRRKIAQVAAQTRVETPSGVAAFPISSKTAAVTQPSFVAPKLDGGKNVAAAQPIPTIDQNENAEKDLNEKSAENIAVLPAPTPNATNRAVKKPERKRAEINSGPPNIRAGSFF